MPLFRLPPIEKLGVNTRRLEDEVLKQFTIAEKSDINLPESNNFPNSKLHFRFEVLVKKLFRYTRTETTPLNYNPKESSFFLGSPTSAAVSALKTFPGHSLKLSRLLLHISHCTNPFPIHRKFFSDSVRSSNQPPQGMDPLLRRPAPSVDPNRFEGGTSFL